MMHTANTLLGAGILALLGAAATSPLKINPPKPVDLISIVYQYENDVTVYTRQVNSDNVIRAPFYVALVDVETEIGLKACDASGSADYGPDEPEVQTFEADEFAKTGCRAAMVPGATYEWVVTVIPFNGEPDQTRSEPFLVPHS